MATNLNPKALLDKSITTTKLSDDINESLAKANSALTEVPDGSVSNSKLDTSLQGSIAKANSAMQSIADGSVTKAKLSTDVQTSLGKADSALQSIADQSISKAKLEMSVQTSLGKAESALQSIPDGSISTVKIVDQAITMDKLENDCIDASKIMDGQVTSTKIADQSIENIHLTDGCISKANLDDELASEIGSGGSDISVKFNGLTKVPDSSHIVDLGQLNQFTLVLSADNYIGNKTNIDKYKEYLNNLGFQTTSASQDNYLTGWIVGCQYTNIDGVACGGFAFWNKYDNTIFVFAYDNDESSYNFYKVSASDGKFIAGGYSLGGSTSTLKTTRKTVTGALNEVFDKATAANTLASSASTKASNAENFFRNWTELDEDIITDDDAAKTISQVYDRVIKEVKINGKTLTTDWSGTLDLGSLGGLVLDYSIFNSFTAGSTLNSTALASIKEAISSNIPLYFRVTANATTAVVEPNNMLYPSSYKWGVFKNQISGQIRLSIQLSESNYRNIIFTTSGGFINDETISLATSDQIGDIDTVLTNIIG